MIDANTTLTLTLPAGMCAVIMDALQAAPYRVAAPVIDELKRQIAAAEPGAFEPQIAAPRVNGIDAVRD